MDWNALIDTLAWPAAVVVLAIIFRQPLSAVISRLSRLRYKNVDIAFDQGVDRVAQKVAEAALEGPEPDLESALPPDTPSVPRSTNYLQELAERLASAAVLESWRELEVAMRETFSTADLDYVLKKPAGSIPVRSLISELRKHHPDNRVFSMVDDLLALRNKVAHTPGLEVSAEKAKQYVRLAKQVERELWKVVGC